MSKTSVAVSRIKRGLAGYITYLEACGMETSFSEYVLYEPILRILTALGYSVSCEHRCPGFDSRSRGDKKRVDFYAKKQGSVFAMEVKWVKKKNTDFSKDVEKLRQCREADPRSRALLCAFGKKEVLDGLDLKKLGVHKMRGKPTYFKRKKYGCLVFQLK